jgi:hypothetical protein
MNYPARLLLRGSAGIQAAMIAVPVGIEVERLAPIASHCFRRGEELWLSLERSPLLGLSAPAPDLSDRAKRKY